MTRDMAETLHSGLGTLRVIGAALMWSVLGIAAGLVLIRATLAASGGDAHVGAVPPPALTEPVINPQITVTETPVAPAAQTADAAALPALEVRDIAATDTTVPLREIETYLNGIRSLRADFTQLAPDGTLSSGILYLERPGRLRFQYEEGSPILIVSDGQTLSFIDYDVSQITRWPIAETPLAPLVAETVTFGREVLVLATGPGALADMTSITLEDPAHPEQGSMTLIFVRAGTAAAETPGLRLQAWEVVDAQGYLTSVSLNNLALNEPMAATLWDFEDPRSRPPRRRRH